MEGYTCRMCKKSFSRADALKRHQYNQHVMSSHVFMGPTTIMISGCTSSGKTTWVKRVLEHKEDLFDSPPPHRVLYCYAEWQPLFDDMKDTMKYVIFHQGLPTRDDIEELADGKHHLVVLDDLMADIVKDETIQHLFTRGSHHKNLSVMYLSQNAFCQGKCARNISLNCAYIVLFKNPRDLYQIQLIGRQIGLPKSLSEAYDDCMEELYGYLVVDLSPRHTGLPRLSSHVFPGEDHVSYLPL